MSETAPSGRARGLFYVLVATAIAGGMGYLIQVLAPALLRDPDEYLTFSVFWSTLYLLVGSVAGIQQEVTRATAPASGPTTRTLRNFVLAAVCTLGIATGIAGVLIAPTVFRVDPLVMAASLVVGVVGYVLVAALAGVLYGLSLWPAIAALTIVDAIARGVLVSAGLLLNASAATLAILTSIPFGLAFAVVWLAARRAVVGRFTLDVEVRRLVLNSASTVVAAAATGVVVTALPLLLNLFLSHEPAVLLASLVAVVTITRAPLIIPLMALQSFLIIDFRAAGPSVGGRLLRYSGLLVAATMIAGIVAYIVGADVISTISDGRYLVAPTVVTAVVASAGLVALLCLTGAALLAAGQHAAYVGGWIVAAVCTVLVLGLLPAEGTVRALVAMLAAPVTGLIVHAIGLRGGARRARAGD